MLNDHQRLKSRDNNNMNNIQRRIYFAGAIRGGRDDRNTYMQIIRLLRAYGEVLTEHVGDGDLSPAGEQGMSDRAIFDRDLEWLTAADVVVAEVSTPSLGVGFEIAAAVGMKKRVIALWREQENRSLSAMIAGCPGVEVIHYSSADDLKSILDDSM